MIPTRAYEQSILGFLKPIQAFLGDPEVSEILINGPYQIYVERHGRLIRTGAMFPSMEGLLSALRNVAQYVGRPIDERHPILEGRLPDGSRIEAVLPPASPCGPSVAIRRFSKDRLTMRRLIEFGALGPDAAELLRALVVCKRNIIISGGTGSGKTSLLNALSSFIPEAERTIVIEDARELQLVGEHVVFLEARPPDAQGRNAVTIRDLFKATLRMRPDRVVVGEIRSGEALDLIQAMTSGHGGCLSTVHASYPRGALNRLETLALMSDVDLPLTALRQQLASAVDIIVQTARLRDGSRRITHISEVRGTDLERGYTVVDLFTGRHVGHSGFELAATGEQPRCEDVIRLLGFPVPASLLQRARSAGGGP